MNKVLSIKQQINCEKGKMNAKVETKGDADNNKVTINGHEVPVNTTYEINDCGTLETKMQTNINTKVTNGEKKVEENTQIIKKETKSNKTDNKDKKDTRSFWQRHPVLRVLLTIFLCLLLVGLLAIAAYHITKAVQKSKAADGENVDNKFPEKDGWFRKTADAVALGGAVGTLGTGIAALVQRKLDQNVDNREAEKNTKTVTQTTTTVTK